LVLGHFLKPHPEHTTRESCALVGWSNMQILKLFQDVNKPKTALKQI